MDSVLAIAAQYGPKEWIGLVLTFGLLTFPLWVAVYRLSTRRRRARPPAVEPAVPSGGGPDVYGALPQGTSLGQPGRVVTRSPAFLRFVGAPLCLAMWVGMLGSVLMAVVERDWLAPVRSSHGGPVMGTIAWLLVSFFLVVLPVAAYLLLSFREVLTTEGVTTRLGRRTTVTSRADVSGITFYPGSVINSRNKPDRVLVTGPDGRNVAEFSVRDRTWRPSLAILSEWVQERPELATNPITRDFFAALRGAQTRAQDGA